MTLEMYLGQNIQERRILVVSDMAKGQAVLRNFEKKTGKLVQNVTCLTLDELAKTLFLYVQSRSGYRSEYELIDDTAVSALIRSVFRENASSMQYLVNEKILNLKTTRELARIIQLIRANGWKDEEKQNARLQDVLRLRDLYETKLATEKLIDNIAMKRFVLQALEAEDAGVCVADALAAQISYLVEDIECYTALDKELLSEIQTEADAEVRVFDSQSVVGDLEHLKGKAEFYKGYGTFNEMNYVANDILEKKHPLGAVTVLYSSPAQVPAIASAFAGNGLPMRLLSSYSMQEDMYVSFVRNILAWAEDEFSEKKLEQILSGPGCCENYFQRIQNAGRRWENQFVLGGGYERNREFVKRERALEESKAAEQKAAEQAAMEQVEKEADADAKDNTASAEKKEINIWDMHTAMLDIFADKNQNEYGPDALVDPAEIYGRLMEFVKTYTRKTAMYKDSVPALAELHVAMKLEQHKIPYREVFAYIKEFIDGLTVSEKEAADAISVCRMGDWELLDRPYVYVTGLALKDMQGNQTESPVLRDAEMDAYLMGGYHPTIGREGERKKTNLYRTIATFEGEQIVFGYSDFDVNGFYENTPSEFYTECLRILQGDSVKKIPEFVYGNPTAGEKYPVTDKWNKADCGLSEKTSSSALEELLSCPKKYAYDRNLHIPEREYNEIDASVWLDATTRGTFFHEIVKNYMNQFLTCDSTVSCEKDAEAIKNDVRKIADKIKIEILKMCPAPYQELADKETDLLVDATAEYLQELHEEYQKEGWRTLVAEQKFSDAEFSVDLYSDQAGRKHDFVIKKGFIDRIDYRVDWDNEELHLRIADYKTGKLNHKKTQLERGTLVQYLIYKNALMDSGKYEEEDKAPVPLLDYVLEVIREREAAKNPDYLNIEWEVCFDEFEYVFPMEQKENRKLSITENDMQGINVMRLKVILTAIEDKKMYPDCMDMREIVGEYKKQYGKTDSGLYELADTVIKTNRDGKQQWAKEEYSGCAYCGYADLCAHRKAGEITNA